MVEPQEPSVSRKIIEHQLNCNKLVFREGTSLPREIIQKSETRIVAFQQFKADIDTDVERVHLVLNDLKKKIRANIHGDLHQDGLLTQNVEDYMRCLSIDQATLDTLLEKDSVYWE